MSTPLITDVWFTGDMLYLRLLDGSEIGTSLEWFPLLRKATGEQMANWRLIGKGIGIHWEELDEDISLVWLLR